MNKLPVYLNDVGLICSLGDNRQEIYERLTNLNHTGLATRDDFIPDMAVTVGAVNTALPSLKDQPHSLQTRTNQLLCAAYQQIESTFSSMREQVPDHRIAIVIGTSTSGIEETEKAMNAASHAIPYDQQNLGNPAEALAQWSGITGPCYGISTACTSGAKALASGRRLLRSGLCDLVLAGGVDSLCKLTLNGFQSLDAVSRDFCLPFSENRSGINIGEGAALFVMSREESSICLSGVGESSDAHHISAPDPEGKGAKLAMKKALDDAKLCAEDIDYLNLHGTATEQNDRMEALAVYDSFGTGLACSSTKGYTGHTLGAAGAIEAAFCYFALEQNNGALPLHQFDGCYDANIQAINLVLDNTTGIVPQAAMSNSFAFGGNNISLILERSTCVSTAQ